MAIVHPPQMKILGQPLFISMPYSKLIILPLELVHNSLCPTWIKDHIIISEVLLIQGLSRIKTKYMNCNLNGDVQRDGTPMRI